MATAGPSTSLTGPVPGKLDPTQPSRVLRNSWNRLVFASFDPRTASSEAHNAHRPSTVKQDLYRPKRIVLETSPNGDSFWRFVPKARCGEGVDDEGAFPRVVEVCGSPYMCSQDQWDIYKLDPYYVCFVHASPRLSVISLVGNTASNVADTTPHVPFVKRAISTPPPEREMAPNPKRHHAYQSVDDLSTEASEDEVEQMMIDSSPPRRRQSTSNKNTRREEMQKNRQARQAKIAGKMAARTEAPAYTDYLRRDSTMHDVSEEPTPCPVHAQSVPPETSANGKRKVSGFAGFTRTLENPEAKRQAQDDDEPSQPFKRTRTTSPATNRRQFQAQKLKREQKKREQDSRRLGDWRTVRDQRFMADVYAEVPVSNGPGIYTPPDTPEHLQGPHTHAHPPTFTQVSPPPEVSPEDLAREAAIAESRRKLADLEADRPLWEEAAKRRAISERLEAESAQAKAEGRRRAAETERKAAAAQAQHERAEAQRREEALRREQEEMARRERDRRQRQQRWNVGPWTTQRALERYRLLSDSFDATKFSPNDPLTFDAVPWPVLTSPNTFSVEDVEWTAVEAFFDAVRPHMRTQDYKTFVSSSHKRFHPDRWRSRGLLTSIADEAERDCLDVAANTVAQALTPIWRELKG